MGVRPLIVMSRSNPNRRDLKRIACCAHESSQRYGRKQQSDHQDPLGITPKRFKYFYDGGDNDIGHAKRDRPPDEGYERKVAIIQMSHPQERAEQAAS